MVELELRRRLRINNLSVVLMCIRENTYGTCVHTRERGVYLRNSCTYHVRGKYDRKTLVDSVYIYDLGYKLWHRLRIRLRT